MQGEDYRLKCAKKDRTIADPGRIKSGRKLRGEKLITLILLAVLATCNGKMEVVKKPNPPYRPYSRFMPNFNHLI
jgi:hypothetical protein